MKILTIIIRSLLGLLFVVFGANGFLQFMKMPTLPPGLVGEFIHSFMTSGYVYVVAGCQLIGGLLLLSGYFVPLGLTILGPVIFNILVFHLVLAREGLGLAIVICILFAFLLWRYWSAFRAIVRP
jgi:uncharacterized membrane protein YphA (DoxX/SURF4 family)